MAPRANSGCSTAALTTTAAAATTMGATEAAGACKRSARLQERRAKAAAAALEMAEVERLVSEINKAAARKLGAPSSTCSKSDARSSSVARSTRNAARSMRSSRSASQTALEASAPTAAAVTTAAAVAAVTTAAAVTAAAPAAAPARGAHGNKAGRVCRHCGTAATPCWRKGPDGCVLCNRCAMHARSHGGQMPALDATGAPCTRCHKAAVGGDDAPAVGRRRVRGQCSGDVCTGSGNSSNSGGSGGSAGASDTGVALPTSSNGSGGTCETLAGARAMPGCWGVHPGALPVPLPAHVAGRVVEPCAPPPVKPRGCLGPRSRRASKRAWEDGPGGGPAAAGGDVGSPLPQLQSSQLQPVTPLCARRAAKRVRRQAPPRSPELALLAEAASAVDAAASLVRLAPMDLDGRGEAKCAATRSLAAAVLAFAVPAAAANSATTVSQAVTAAAAAMRYSAATAVTPLAGDALLLSALKGPHAELRALAACWAGAAD